MIKQFTSFFKFVLDQTSNFLFYYEIFINYLFIKKVFFIDSKFSLT